MLNKDIHITHYISILKRRKWILISFFFITVTAVSFLTFTQKKVYRATATVIVDAESPDVLSVKDVVKLGENNYFAYRDYIETQQEIIRSRRTAYRVGKNLNLFSMPEYKNTKDPIAKLLKKLHVELIRDTRIIRISVDDENPILASRIANEFAKVYASSNIALKIQLSKEAQAWLEEELRKQERKVRQSELNLQSYKEKNDIISLKSQENIINDSLTKLNTSYLKAQEDRIRSETVYKSLLGPDGNIRLDILPAVLTDNKTLQELKNDYLKQESILVEYRKIYKDKHPKMIRLMENIEHLKSRIKDEVETEYKNAMETERKFAMAIEEQKKKALELERKIINYNALERELETNERILQMVLNRLKETSISSQIQTNNVRVQDLAEAPRNPIRPRKKLNIAISMILGLVGGTMLAFFREYIDTSLKDPNEIANFLQLSVLGSVPKIRSGKKGSGIEPIIERDAQSIAAEAYRLIRTNLLFSLNHSSSPKSIVITSSVPKEGKTLTATNLAIMIANSGERVLLVDADMRKPRVHTIFNETNVSGLSQFLAGEIDFETVVRPTRIENLYIITSGKPTSRSAELLASQNTRIFLDKAYDKFSKVIFDTPPVGLVTDAQILGNISTGVILVVDTSRTTKSILSRSKELLQKVDARILGVIVNNVSLVKDIDSYPQYYYGKYYSQV